MTTGPIWITQCYQNFGFPHQEQQTEKVTETFTGHLHQDQNGPGNIAKARTGGSGDIFQSPN
eukprot:gene12634-20664_t